MDWGVDPLLLVSGPWLLVLLGGAALVEYVFPPFPGDTVTLLGAVLAVRGEASPAAVLAVVTAGSAVGASLSYAAGVWIRARGPRPAGGPLARLLSPELLARAAVQYRRWGLWLVLVNRFIPATRSLIFVFAGMSGLRFLPTLLVGTLSAAVWNTLLILAGFAVGANLEALQQAVTRWNLWVWTVLAVAVLAGGAVWLVRRRRRGSATAQPLPPGTHVAPGALPLPEKRAASSRSRGS